MCILHERNKKSMEMVWQGGTGNDSRTTNELGATLLRRGGLGRNQRVKWGGSPGPHGIPVFFYRDFWDLVRPDVMTIFEEFHLANCGMERINKSYLFLLPKCQRVDRVEDFQPIYLSNSIYLIIAKVLASRLHEVINDLVGPFQSTFIPGRQLVDSIVVAGEIVAP